MLVYVLTYEFHSPVRADPHREVNVYAHPDDAEVAYKVLAGFPETYQQLELKARAVHRKGIHTETGVKL